MAPVDMKKHEDSVQKRGKARANPMPLSFYCISCRVPGCVRSAVSDTHSKTVHKFIQDRKCPLAQCYGADVERGTLKRIQVTSI